jgi:uncharacterized protein DUF6144
MGTDSMGMIEQIGGNIEQYAGIEDSKKIMAGSEELTEHTARRDVARWVKTAMDRLDTEVDKGTAARIMENCGDNCSKKNHSVIKTYLMKRDKFGSVDKFLEAEIQNPMLGTRIERDGDILYHIYTPKSFTPPLRCYCALFNELPEDETVSKTYCNCSKAFVKNIWEAVLEKPVEVELQESVISGGDTCRFKIKM